MAMPNNNNDTETNYQSMIVENTTTTLVSGTNNNNSRQISTLPVVHTYTSNTVYTNEQQQQQQQQEQEQTKKSVKNNTARETILYGILLVITVLWEKRGFIGLNKRPIPYQILDITNDENDNNEQYYIRDLTNNQSILSETFSSNFGLLVGFILPYIIQFVLSVWNKWSCSKNDDDTNIDDIHGTICTYNVSYTLVTIVTEFCKNYVGYLRPIFYELCQPNDTYDTCTGTNSKDVSNSHKSFPSGHASTAFCGLTLLSLYVHTRYGIPSIPKSYTIVTTTSSSSTTNNDSNEIRIVHNKNNTTNNNNNNNNRIFQCRCYSLLSLVPITFALFIAVSRIHDNRHFPADVIAGSLLGASISIFVFNLWML